jgi:hypothetical protein
VQHADQPQRRMSAPVRKHAHVEGGALAPHWYGDALGPLLLAGATNRRGRAGRHAGGRSGRRRVVDSGGGRGATLRADELVDDGVHDVAAEVDQSGHAGIVEPPALLLRLLLSGRHLVDRGEGESSRESSLEVFGGKVGRLAPKGDSRSRPGTSISLASCSRRLSGGLSFACSPMA